ncbi:MAG: hydrolase [Bacteroidales bacterium]|nr:hydrolase [Bacteroidales bacterium]
MRILKEQSIGLLIDLQERLFPHIHDNDQLLRNISILLDGFEILSVPLIVTEQYRKGLGETHVSIRRNIDNFNPLEKMVFSCCEDKYFMQELENSGKKYVIIAGIEAHVCVLQTTVDLVASGYQPVVVEDCISSRKSNDKVVALKRMIQEGALITTYESVLFELARISGTEVFKSISRLVK